MRSCIYPGIWTDSDLIIRSMSSSAGSTPDKRFPCLCCAHMCSCLLFRHIPLTRRCKCFCCFFKDETISRSHNAKFHKQSRFHRPAVAPDGTRRLQIAPLFGTPVILCMPTSRCSYRGRTYCPRGSSNRHKWAFVTSALGLFQQTTTLHVMRWCPFSVPWFTSAVQVILMHRAGCARVFILDWFANSKLNLWKSFYKGLLNLPNKVTEYCVPESEQGSVYLIFGCLECALSAQGYTVSLHPINHSMM